MITSEWGTPNMVKDGVNPELLLGGKYGNALHVWDLRKRKHVQKLELGAEQQMVLELRPAHNPARAYGFVGVVISLEDLSSSIWMWYRDEQRDGEWKKVRKVIEIPAEPADPRCCRRCSRASAPCRRWSPTSTSRSTTASCTSPAGARASCGSTT
jgi:methanethiol oxidase